MTNANEQIGGIINAVKRSVQQFGIDPHSAVVVRVGETGPFLRIAHVKVSGGLNPFLILETEVPQ